MKILVLANKVPYPPTDGGAIATLNMCLGLSGLGAKLYLLAMSTHKHPTQSSQIPNDILRSFSVETVFVDTKISLHRAIKNLLFSKLPYNAERFVSLPFSLRLSEILASESFDLIQLEGLYLTPYLSLIRKVTNVPIVLRSHNVEHEIWQRSSDNESNLFKKTYFRHLSHRIRKMEMNALSNVSYLVPITQRDGRILSELGFKGVVHVSQTGFYFDNRSKEEINVENQSVFHIGGLDWFPNIEGLNWFLNKCWPIVKEKIPTAHFYIAGRNASQDFVRKLSSINGVVFCGEVPDSKDFISSKGVMVVPLLSGSGMRIKIVEGMALGKAIVSTSTGVEGIDAEDGTHLLIGNSAEDFANHVISLLMDEYRVKKLGENAQQFAFEKLDNRIISERLLTFYKTITK